MFIRGEPTNLNPNFPSLHLAKIKKCPLVQAHALHEGNCKSSLD